ncbi:MAG TPA: glutamyl-tRNA reductase [Thermoanaerobaculia bacterium]|nr:glutamyl-tRNA reductase [Thermoanaerobaculia bacterium]
MTLLCLGVSHHTAELDLREALQRGGPRLERELRTLRACPGVRWRLLEWALLETCNRFELYASIEGQPWAFEAWLLHRLERHAEIDHRRAARALRRWTGDDAARHLFEVAAGVDSMVLGESEILGQVRRAGRRAEENATLGDQLSLLFESAVRAGRRARHSTDIGRDRSTVSSLAITRVEERVERLEEVRALVVGLGEMGHLTLSTLRRRGVTSIGVVNRTEERARDLASSRGLRWWRLDELEQALAWADVVFTCAKSRAPLIAARSLASAVAARETPVLLIDLALPRNVEAACAEVPGVEVLSLDELGSEADEAVRRRREALPRVREVLAVELDAWARERSLRSVAPAIRELRRWSESLRVAELERLRRALGELDEAGWAAVEGFSRSLTDKLLHTPTTRLRESAASGAAAPYLEALNRLFEPGVQRRDGSASA